MAKFFTFFTIALVLSFTLSNAARRDPSSTINAEVKVQKSNVGAAKAVEDESCHGINRDDCLMRRTLVAHLDYIYTQENKP